MLRFLAASVIALLALAAPPARGATVSPPPPEHRADPALTTYVERAGPFEVGAYDTLSDSVRVPPPPVAGAIVGMDARLVDARGAVIPQHIAMLHHLVFTNGGPDGGRGDPACPFSTTRERFWGTSEELRPLTLPRGYGYATSPADQWRALLMVMHHRAGDREIFLEYRVTVDPRPAIPVKPYWLSVIPCVPDPQWSVPGDRRGAYLRSRTFSMPGAGRIVAFGGHLHGGALELRLSQPACDDRTLARARPSYAPARDPLYAVRPLLHEPDPKSISWWQSATGWPIRSDEKLTVTAAYDGSRPHMRVMGIGHVYVAPPVIGPPPPRCAPPPPDAQVLGPDFRGARSAPPRVDLTLSRLGSDGVARPTTRAPGPAEVASDDARVTVDDYAFRPAHVTVASGATVRWRFAERVKHDVTVAAGPLGFASPWLTAGGSYARRFSEPGTYLLQCSLHAAYMSQVIRVTREPPPLPGAGPLPR
jgi:plastocyanin